MIFKADLTNEIKALTAKNNVYAVTDENVFALYEELFIKERTFVLTPGENSKTLDAVTDICRFLLVSGADRHSGLAAVGGGVVGDTAGFAASVFMRGIDFISVPTTLLSQVDSGTGGKTGVNLDGAKNMIGSFWFPSEVYISSLFLKTLNDREYLCGLGETIKTAFLSPKIFDFLERNLLAVLDRDYSVLAVLVRLCTEFKQSVVDEDPKEINGRRKILNYGHTAGHAFETADGYALSHGEYILYGIKAEISMLEDKVDTLFFKKADKIISAALGGRTLTVDLDKAVAAAAVDKKNRNGEISILSVIRPGETEEVFLTRDEFKKRLKKFLGR